MNPRQCEFCDKELPPQAEYDACDTCIELMKTLINDPPVRTIQPDDTWDCCTRCGCEVNDADVWPEFCPRCQQLAALEREIGRAVIQYLILDNDYECLPDSADDEVFNDMARQMTELELEQARLFTQWRKLHAEGAEAEAATERQEGER